MRIIPKPLPGEYPPYADMYMKLLPEGVPVLEHLRSQTERTCAMARGFSEAQLLRRYAPGKWSLKEVLVHIVDDERIFAYRALRFARNEQSHLIGFDQDAYAAESGANPRPLESILAEYEAVRMATIALFEGQPEASLTRLGHGTGSANDATVRALCHHIAGHELHHLKVIQERYL